MECRFKICKCKNTEDWKIRSKEFNDCFWTYFLFNSRPHTLNEIAELLGISLSAVTVIEKKALAKLKKKLSKNL